ncbi:MAG: glycosyltransferase family 2 protein, partial [Lachnospiraceae bacterium]|nr:glycosyltransferase family 2 protein [Lachnospiraceae bacterium]
MERIIQRINDSDWEAAAEALLDVMETHEFNDTIAVLAATINEQLGDDDMMFSFIEKGLLYNYKNYELYLLLGNYYAARNVNQAYLCYENALYFCEGTEDYEYISELLDNFKKENSVNVPPYSFVILSYNTLELTRKCIESIRRNCKKGSYEIIIVDNASSDGSLEYLRQQEDIALIANDVNVGFPAGCNQGIAESAQGNDIMLLNSDTIVMPNAMFTLRMGLYASEDNGTAGCVTNFSGNSQIIGESFESIADYENYSIKNNIMREHIYEYKAWLVGFALLLKRSALDCVGEGLDERFSPGNFEDDDLCLRMLSMGYH